MLLHKMLTNVSLILFREYLNIMFQIWMKTDKPSPSPFGVTIKALFQAAICMGVYLSLEPRYPLSRITEPIYKTWGFIDRLTYQFMCSFTTRWKYYFIWSVSEAAMILSGLGFSGWTNSFPLNARWGRAKNVDILGVEFAKNAVEIPLAWNIHVSTWLRHCKSSFYVYIECKFLFIYLDVDVRMYVCLDVYDRLVKKGKKPGFFQLLVTQTISAIWHVSFYLKL